VIVSWQVRTCLYIQSWHANVTARNGCQWTQQFISLVATSLTLTQCDSLLAGKHPEQGQTVRKGHGVPQACKVGCKCEEQFYRMHGETKGKVVQVRVCIPASQWNVADQEADRAMVTTATATATAVSSPRRRAPSPAAVSSPRGAVRGAVPPHSSLYLHMGIRCRA
jgi:hypothetical protein